MGLNGGSRDAWHLLGLLVAAQKDLGAALQVLETALDEETEGEKAANRVARTNGFDFPRDDTEQFVTEVQIRMSKNVVIEAMEGPAAALLDQQALLAFFSQAFKRVKDVPGASFSLSRRGWGADALIVAEIPKQVPVTISTSATARRAPVLGGKRSAARTVSGDAAGSTRASSPLLFGELR